MRDSIIDDVSKATDVILCGDARMDSPGFGGTKATYSFIEEEGSHRAVNGDKRQVCVHELCIYCVHVHSQHPHCCRLIYNPPTLRHISTLKDF